MKVLVLAGAVTALSDTLCEHHFTGKTTQVISCPGGKLKLNSATYGRQNGDNTTCCKNKRLCKGNPGGTCTKSALDLIGRKCDGESECTIYGNMNGLIGDPCFRNHKYLNYDYECDYSSPQKVASFCEMEMVDRTTSFECPAGTKIAIVQATWGRAKDHYCCPKKQEKQCQAAACGSSFDATAVMGARCNGGTKCQWDQDDIELVDPCPKTFKYMSVQYRCDRPLAMADSQRMPNALTFSPTTLTGNNCADLLALSKTKLVVSMDKIASEASGIHKGWFGQLSDQEGPAGNGQKRKGLFPKNYQKLDKWLDESCNCQSDKIAQMNQMEVNPWTAFKSVHAAMNTVAEQIYDQCPKASDHLVKKLRHAWNFLVVKEKRQNHLVTNFQADPSKLKRQNRK